MGVLQGVRDFWLQPGTTQVVGIWNVYLPLFACLSFTYNKISLEQKHRVCLVQSSVKYLSTKPCLCCHAQLKLESLQALQQVPTSSLRTPTVSTSAATDHGAS